MNKLDNPYSNLVEIFREQGAKYNSPDLMLGEVLTPFPDITIKVGGIQLYKDNLYLSDYLLNNYKRNIEIEGKTDISDGSAAGTTASASVSEHGSHKHNINSINISDAACKTIGTIKYTTSCLNAGDIVAIQQINGTNQFIVYNKLIKL